MILMSSPSFIFTYLFIHYAFLLFVCSFCCEIITRTCEEHKKVQLSCSLIALKPWNNLKKVHLFCNFSTPRTITMLVCISCCCYWTTIVLQNSYCYWWHLELPQLQHVMFFLLTRRSAKESDLFVALQLQPFVSRGATDPPLLSPPPTSRMKKPGVNKHWEIVTFFISRTNSELAEG